MAVRYAYAISGILLAGGAAATLALQEPVGAQVAQNAPGTIQPAVPRLGAPGSFADLTERLQPAVVNISTTQRIEVPQQNNPFAGTPFGDLFDRFGGGPGGGQPGQPEEGDRPITREATSLGSGFIISADGYVVTNNHVISARGPNGVPNADPVDSITVTLPDRTEYQARIIGRDAASDLAVLKIDGDSLPFVQFGSSEELRVGDWVMAIGNPFGLGGTVTAGIVSAMHRTIGLGGAYDRYIQTDASINQGNSGGPMFDLEGNVVGINTAIFSPTGGNVGIGFAIPASEARPIVETLARGEEIQRGYLGVGIQPMTDDIAESLGLPANRGEIVARVEPGQAAARAGIRQGDIVIEVDGREVTPDETLSYIVANLEIGRRVPIVLLREGEQVRVTAVIGERPSDQEMAALLDQDGEGEEGLEEPGKGESEDPAGASTLGSIGMTFQSMNPAIARQLGVAPTVRGLVIVQVDPSSDAAQKGIQRGDIIVAINRQAVQQPADAVAAIDAARRAGRSSVLLFLQRGNNPPRYIGVDLVE